MSMSKLRLWRLCALALMLTAGCAGYHLGPAGGQTAGEHSIQVEPFVNRTMEPRLTDYMVISLRKNLMQDGTYRINTQGDADLMMTGQIIKYERSGISFQPTDVLTVLDYDIAMIAHIIVKERSTGKVVFDKDVTARIPIRAGADLASAERQSIPMLTDDLAKRVTTMLVDGTW